MLFQPRCDDYFWGAVAICPRCNGKAHLSFRVVKPSQNEDVHYRSKDSSFFRGSNQKGFGPKNVLTGRLSPWASKS
jgi:hypothetical protein